MFFPPLSLISFRHIPKQAAYILRMLFRHIAFLQALKAPHHGAVSVPEYILTDIDKSPKPFASFLRRVYRRPQSDKLAEVLSKAPLLSYPSLLNPGRSRDIHLRETPRLPDRLSLHRHLPKGSQLLAAGEKPDFLDGPG